MEGLAIDVERLLPGVPGAADLNAERSVGGTYLALEIKREAIARYGISVAEVQEVIEVAISGMTVSNTIEGRRRFSMVSDTSASCAGGTALAVIVATGMATEISQIASLIETA
ncbi:MAG: efflux RND transporter permease subunit, partial [Candidatus Sericytochromatia bacterium]|nr:efflux RND transporter permease subunit [Candidatus Sericytochromatia bacterium]